MAPALQKYKELLLKLKGSRFVDERAWWVREERWTEGRHEVWRTTMEKTC